MYLSRDRSGASKSLNWTPKRKGSRSNWPGKSGFATLFLALAGTAWGLTNPPLTGYVTYLGGSGAETVAGIAVDPTGSEYVAGTTNSPDFPVLYASNCPINAVVPFGVGSMTTALASVQSGSLSLSTVPLLVVAAAPGKFASVLNQDGTINSASNPAQRGTIVAVYMTGTGALTPAIPDGSIGPLSPPFPAPVQSIAASVGLFGAPVLFSGQAPGLIAGATQVNIQIPQNAATGTAVPVIVSAGGYNRPEVNVAIQ